MLMATRNNIYSFFPNVSHGCKIFESPDNSAYLSITMDEIKVAITDQDSTLLNLTVQNLTIRFRITEAR